MGIGLVTNCIPPKTPLGNIADKAATFILYDQKVNAMYDASYMVLEAIKRTYPCVKS